MNNQNHARAMKIRPETKKMSIASYDLIFMQDHEDTCFIQFWDVFHEIWMKKCFCNPRWKSVSHGVWWMKKFWSWRKNTLSWENKWYVLVFILRKVFWLEKIGCNGKSWKTQAKSCLLSKISSKLSLFGSSHSLQS